MDPVFEQILRDNPSLRAFYENQVLFVPINAQDTIWWCNFWIIIGLGALLITGLYLWRAVHYKKLTHEAAALIAVSALLLGGAGVLVAKNIRDDAQSEIKNPEIAAKMIVTRMLEYKPVK